MAEPLRPPTLRPGDGICLLAPSRPADPDRVTLAAGYLEARGHRVHRDPRIHRRYHYLGGTDEERAGAVMEAFLDDEVAALLCVRGGFGAGRLLDRLDFDAIAAHPKPVIGFSDTTALHLALYARCGLVGVTGVLADTDLGRRPVDPLLEASLWSLLTNPATGAGPVSAVDSGLVALRPGRAEGRLVPANLALLCSLLGTSYVPDLTGAILLIEDVDEAPYRIDRMLTQLRLAGILGRLGGLVLGTFCGCFLEEHMAESPTLAQIVDDALGETRLPVLGGVAYGHQRRRVALPLGVRARVDAAVPELRILEPAVARWPVS